MCETRHNLAHTVGAEVEENDRVVVLKRHGILDADRVDKLIGHACRVGCLDSSGGTGRNRIEPLRNRIVPALGSLPAAVAVHCVVAAADGGDLGIDLVVCHKLFEFV